MQTVDKSGMKYSTLKYFSSVSWAMLWTHLSLLFSLTSSGPPVFTDLLEGSSPSSPPHMETFFSPALWASTGLREEAEPRASPSYESESELRHGRRGQWLWACGLPLTHKHKYVAHFDLTYRGQCSRTWPGFMFFWIVGVGACDIQPSVCELIDKL